jgi:transposase
MSSGERHEPPILSPEAAPALEDGMIDRERWEEIRRRHLELGQPIAEIARLLDLDRKTVRRCLQQEAWRPYSRPVRADTLLAGHAAFLRERAPQVQYSARILFQELRRDRGFAGSYDTVKRFVAPLRELGRQAECCQMRFETPPGQQSQVDWGQALVSFRDRPVRLHVFVLTLGYSRRSFYRAGPDETLSQFLDAHELAFEHFGGLTRECLYDRPRTVCHPGVQGQPAWNPTFRAFAGHWGFEPRLCRPYRAQTKGKVESGVKYLKRNFLPGRRFVDIEDFHAQLAEWMASIADLRIHGTTHERPADRFARERDALLPVAGHGRFRLQARLARIVAEDYLVSFETNRYSVPFHLIGRTVEVQREGAELRIFHRDRLVARHPLLAGRHQLHILPEHGPGAVARNARRLRSAVALPHRAWSGPGEVEVRDPAVYERLFGEGLP